MLADRLSKAWRLRQATVPLTAEMTFKPGGLVLGADTVLAPADDGCLRLRGQEDRLIALLAAAHLRPVGDRSLRHIRKAALRWSEGEVGLAEVHLALSGFRRLDNPVRDAERLFLADNLMVEGASPETILRALGFGAPDALDKDYQDQPRVPKGNGKPSGQWTIDGTAGAGRPTGKPTRRPARQQARAPSGLASRLPELLEAAPRTAGPAVGGARFLGLTGEQLFALGMFALRFGGPMAALGTVFIPLNRSLRKEGTVGGWPPIHYLWHEDQRVLAFTYLGPGLKPVHTLCVAQAYQSGAEADGFQRRTAHHLDIRRKSSDGICESSL